jgi:hypothetical protein
VRAWWLFEKKRKGSRELFISFMEQTRAASCMPLHIEGNCMEKGMPFSNTSLQQSSPLKPFPVELFVKKILSDSIPASCELENMVLSILSIYYQAEYYNFKWHECASTVLVHI